MYACDVVTAIADICHFGVITKTLPMTNAITDVF